MVDFREMWSSGRWFFFILIVGLVTILVLGINFFLSVAEIKVSNLLVSFCAGIISGVLLIVFDIVVLQGLGSEDTRKEDRMEEIVETVVMRSMHSQEFRNVIRKEIKEAFKEKNL